MPDNKVQPDPIVRLYNNIKKEYDLPDFNTFKVDMSDSNKVKRLHATLVGDGYEVPDYDVFSVDMGLKKKDILSEKSNLYGTLSDPTELLLSSIKNSQQSAVVQNPDPFDKNANPAALARQSFDLKKPSELKENVSVTPMGLPVISYSKEYDGDKIKTSNEIDKYLEGLGYSKDFVNKVSRIPESYRESTGYTDQELSDLYRNDRNSFNKRTSEVLFREELASGMNDIKASIIRNNNLAQEQKDAQLSKIQDEEFLQNQEAMSTGSGLKNKQYFIGQTAKRIKQFIADPEKKREALEDLATYAADDFGSLEDLEDKKNNPISPNINEEQSVALNYLEQIDPDKAAFYKKYLDVDKNKLTKFEYKGYQQIFKELDEIGLNLSINSAQNEIKPLVDLAKQQGGILDPVDYEKYNKLLETINLASTRLAKIDQIYPDAKDLDTESIAQDLVGGRSSMLGAVGKKFMYNLGKTGKGIVDIAAAPFRTQQENDNAALEALGIEIYIAPTTTSTSKNSLIARGEAKLTPELESQRQAIIKDKSLSQDEKVDKMIDLLERNPDKWIRPSDETSWNVGFFPIVSSLLNFTADIAPFIALETLTAGGATPTAGYGLVSSFGKMFANVAVTSYSDELARQLKEKNPNPESAAFSNILVNTIAYKVAGASDMVKAIRGASKEFGVVVEKAISKLDDKAILTALENPPKPLKSFFSDLSKTVVESGKKGFQTGLTFETIMGGKEVLEGAKIDDDFIKSRLVGLLNFTLFNVATKAPFGMPKIDKQSKEALFLAAKNKDQFLYEAEKSFANKQISESEYNQIKNNVDAASKVLERVPTINNKGEELGTKEASELMYLKIQQQFLKDKADKELPLEVKEKITKQISDVQDKIDKVYKGEFIDDAGKPFAGIEDIEAKRKIEETTEPAQEPVVLTETKPTEVKVTEEINADAGKEPVIEEKGAEKKTLDSELRDALNYDFYESQLNSKDKWEREDAKKYLADPKKYFESKIELAKEQLSDNPNNDSAKILLEDNIERLRVFNEINNKYKQNIAQEKVAPVIKKESTPTKVEVTEEVKKEQLPITEKIPEATVEVLRRGYEVISGNKDNSIGDIRGEANERRSKGEKFFIKETVKDGKDIFTLVDTTVYDEWGRSAYKSASVEVPKNSRLSAEALMSKLKSELGVTDKINLQYLDKMTSEMKAKQEKAAEVKVTKEAKPTETKTVEQLRAEEQAEYDNMANPNDKVRRKEIYEKYDKLISPLLEGKKQEVKKSEVVVGGKENEIDKANKQLQSTIETTSRSWQEKNINRDEHPLIVGDNFKEGYIIKVSDVLDYRANNNGERLGKSVPGEGVAVVTKITDLGNLNKQGAVEVGIFKSRQEANKWIAERDNRVQNLYKDKISKIDSKYAESIKEAKPTEAKAKEEKTFAQKDLDRAEAKKIHSRVSDLEPPIDAEQVALRYLAEGGKVSQDAINEVSGTTKRASLNTGRRELKTAEAKARDYEGGKESLDDLAHRLWENSGQEISERDIKDALMSEIANNNTRLDASKTYLERYNIEYQEEKYYERFIEKEAEEHAKVQEELERDLRRPLEEETEGMSSEEHIDNLIKQYEAEIKRENKQIGSEGKGEAVEEISSRDIGKKAPKETELAKDYKEALEKVSKKAKENAKKDFVERNFDSIVEKLKIQIKCPT
jgi:hypothetical protein